MMITKYDEKRILVDNGSSINILFYNVFVWINLPKNQLRWVSIPLVDFFEDSIGIKGEITLPVITKTLP